MKYRINIKLFVVLHVVLFLCIASAERIILKDGSAIVGDVLEENNENLIVKTSFGTIIIDRANISKRTAEEQPIEEDIYRPPFFYREPKVKITIDYGYGAIHSGLGVSLGFGTPAFQLFGSIGNFNSYNDFLYSGGIKLFMGKSHNAFFALGFGGKDYVEEEYWIWWQQYTKREPLYGPTLALGYELKLGRNKNYLIIFDGGISYRTTKIFGTVEQSIDYSKISPAFDLAVGVRF